jgi:uncharacterized protein (DUF1330 family)
MNWRLGSLFAAALLVGAAVGSGLTTALHAQSTPPAYVLAEEVVHDADTFNKEYAPKVLATLQPYGGRFVVRGGALTALEGDPPMRLAMIMFDSVEKARAWYASAAYQQIAPIRHKASKTTMFIAEGIPN